MFTHPDSLRSLRAYVTFANEHLPAISEINAAAYARVPAFVPMLTQLEGEAMLAQNRANMLRITAAAADGKWQPYIESLRTRGASYARMGMDFTDWTNVFRYLKSGVIDLVFQILRDDEDRRWTSRGVAELLDVVVQVVGQEFFDTQTAALREKDAAIRTLGTTVLVAEPRVLVVPLIGEVDDERVRILHAKLLPAIRAERARAVVLDLTGVAALDSNAMAQLGRLSHAAELMGARVILSGLAPDLCRSLVEIGVDVPAGGSFATLAEALADARR
jgi:rsbT co-antagonist protein RsbR